jgi:hypothetical protein
MADAPSSSSADDKDNAKCNTLLAKALATNPHIQKLVDSIDVLGCTIPKDFFACRQCDATITGGFAINTSEDGAGTFLPKVSKLCIECAHY